MLEWTQEGVLQKLPYRCIQRFKESVNSRKSVNRKFCDELLLEKLPQTRKNVRALRRFLIGKSTEMECDRQGRILIPSHLRNYAQLGKDAKIIGVGDTIEVWSPAVLAASEEESGAVADIAESLDLPMDFNL